MLREAGEVRGEALVATGWSLEVREVPVKYSSGEYLVKPLGVHLCGFDNAVAYGYLPVTKPTIVGSTGVARVIEAGYGAREELSGKIVLVSPIAGDKLIGYTRDGLLAKYSSIPSEAIAFSLNKFEAYHAAWFHLALAQAVNELVAGKTILIVGGGLASLALALLANNSSPNIAILTYSRRSARLFKDLGLEVINDVISAKCCFEAVFYNTLSLSAARALNKVLSQRSLIYLNPLINSMKLRTLGEVTLVKVNPGEKHIGQIYGVWSKLNRYIKVIKVEDVKSTLGLLPVDGSGAIVLFQH